MTQFSWIVEHMKRPKDNEADSFGITVTMRGKHKRTPAWVSLKTHYTVETHTRTHANTTKFPPIVISATQKDSPNVTFLSLFCLFFLNTASASPLTVLLTQACLHLALTCDPITSGQLKGRHFPTLYANKHIQHFRLQRPTRCCI